MGSGTARAVGWDRGRRRKCVPGPVSRSYLPPRGRQPLSSLSAASSCPGCRRAERAIDRPVPTEYHTHSHKYELLTAYMN